MWSKISQSWTYNRIANKIFGSTSKLVLVKWVPTDFRFFHRRLHLAWIRRVCAAARSNIVSAQVTIHVDGFSSP